MECLPSDNDLSDSEADSSMALKIPEKRRKSSILQSNALASSLLGLPERRRKSSVTVEDVQAQGQVKLIVSNEPIKFIKGVEESLTISEHDELEINCEISDDHANVIWRFNGKIISASGTKIFQRM